MVGDELRQKPARGGERLPGIGGEEVLEQKGHAGERPGRSRGGVRDGQGAVVHLVHDGVERRIPGLDARNRALDQLGRPDLPGADQFGEAKGVVVLVFVEIRHPWNRIRGTAPP